MGTIIRAMPLAEIPALVGTELGVSEWFHVTQDRITQFGEATADLNEVHIDPEIGRSWGFDGTIAHGFFTLSLILKLQEGLVPMPDNFTHGFNYGLERVRFISPVPCGSRVRGRFRLADFREKSPGGWLATVDTAIEIEGQEKPAVTCQWLTISFVPQQ